MGNTILRWGSPSENGGIDFCIFITGQDTKIISPALMSFKYPHFTWRK